MEGSNSTYRWQRVEQAEAVRLLTNPKAARYFFPFMLHEQSPSSAAAFLGLRLNVLMYWVRRFLALGLIEVTRIEPRGGRPLRFYRATANAFFVPFKALSARDLEDFYQELRQPFQAALGQSLLQTLSDPALDWGLWISSQGGVQNFVFGDAEGRRAFNNRKPGAPATIQLQGSLNLDFEQAKRFQHELIELYQKYLGYSGGQRYLLNLAFVAYTP